MRLQVLRKRLVRVADAGGAMTQTFYRLFDCVSLDGRTAVVNDRNEPARE